MKHFVAGGVPFIWKAYRRHKFDVLHCQGEYYAAWSGYWFETLKGVPYVCKVIGEGFRAADPYFKLRRRLKQGLCSATAVIAQSESMRTTILEHGVAQNRIVLIHNGVALADYQDGKPGQPAVPKPFILYAGGLRRAKGYDVLLRAFASIAGKFSNHKLVMIGDNKEEARFHELVHDYRLDNRVHYMGYCSREEKINLFRNAAIYVAPYHRAQFSTANLEALASGVPIIATAVDNNKEQIRDGLEGYLVSPDDPVNLADRMASLLVDEEARREMSANALERARMFDWDTMLDRYEQLYASIVER